MAEVDDFGARGNTLPELPGHFFKRMGGQGDGLVFVHRPTLLADELPGVIAGAVFVVAGEDLVARLQLQRTGHDVDAMRGVGHKDQVTGGGVEILAQGLAGLAIQHDHLAAEEKDGLAPKEPWLRKWMEGSRRKREFISTLRITITHFAARCNSLYLLFAGAPQKSQALSPGLTICPQ